MEAQNDAQLSPKWEHAVATATATLIMTSCRNKRWYICSTLLLRKTTQQIHAPSQCVTNNVTSLPSSPFRRPRSFRPDLADQAIGPL